MLRRSRQSNDGDEPRWACRDEGHVGEIHTECEMESDDKCEEQQDRVATYVRSEQEKI